MAPRVCVLGSVNLDMIIQTARLPKAGETIGGGNFSTSPGGKGANIALAAKRLGANTELRAAVGNDEYAEQALANLRAEGVDLGRLIIKDNHPTGLAFINVSDDGENQIAVAAGANGAFSPGDLTTIKADALVTQFEIPEDTVLTAIKNFDGLTCLNASPVIADLRPFLPHVDVLIVNTIEVEYYSGPLSGFKGLIAETRGADGAALFKDGKEIAAARPPVVQAVDTTGAGDCFAAALTVALSEKQDFENALKFAVKTASVSTTALGAQAASPRRSQVD